jgi:hypothetical protein
MTRMQIVVHVESDEGESWEGDFQLRQTIEHMDWSVDVEIPLKLDSPFSISTTQVSSFREI